MREKDIGALLTDVVDEMLEGLQVISPDWRYLYVNATVARQGKTTKEALVGRTMMECYPGIEKTPLFVQLRRCLEERVSIRMENEFVFPDGSKGWFQLNIHPVKEGLMILSSDITDLKTSRQKLKATIEELDRAFRMIVIREARMLELKAMISELKDLSSREPPAVVIRS